MGTKIEPRVLFPGELRPVWKPKDGTHGIGVVELDREFVDAVLQEANMPGALVSVSTNRGTIQATGKVRRGLVELVIAAYIVAARKAVDAEGEAER